MSWLAVRTFFGRIPQWAWIALAAVVLIFLGVRWYNGQLKEADAAGYSRAEKDIAAKALALKAKADALNTKIATAIRNRNNESINRIDADARSVLVRGPGKASCPGYASVPAKPGGHVAPAGPSGSTVAPMPDSGGVDLIALPFAGAVGLAEQHDKCRTDLLSYREWERQVRDAWPRP